jgi:antitoxin ParD1/3/4
MNFAGDGDMAISADLGATLEKVVNDLVENGRYNSKSEVLREGVRLVQEREARLRELDEQIAVGLAQADAGLLIPAEEVFAELRQIVAEIAKKAS